ncbi:beta-glucosidase D [Apiospora rasikravindrae]|uniref:beta-glucosidase n=1 Tax=Apiospora rasikravindrae TaxID=990691 RepID=A0ABR1SE79_9PEZI
MAFRCAFLVSLLLALPAQVLCQRPYNDWAKAYAEAEELVGSWTRYQVANVSVYGGTAPGHVPFTAKDGPMGLNGGRGVSGWIAAQSIASSWDPELVEKQYAAMAREFRSKGYSMQLGPVTGPMGRSALGGRNFESFGSDPFLGGKMFGSAVRGIQGQDVIACGKHFVGNEQETNRTRQSGSGEDSDGTDRSSTNMDDRTLHELYLWPWVDGVVNGLGAVMCVMNRVNGTGGCENDYTLNQVLKKEVGFKGPVIPDATAPINSTAALINGLDWNSGMDLAAISALIDDGTIPEEVMRQHAIRVVATQLNHNLPQAQYPDPATTINLNVREPESAPLIRSAAAQSIVLLKNTNNALPLQNATSIGVFGLDAAQAVTGPAMVPNVYDYQGETYAGHLASGGGSGATPMPYLVDPLTALAARAAAGAGFEVRYIASDNYTVLPSGGVKPGGGPPDSVSGFASGSQYCLVFLNAFAKEGADRLTLADETGDKLVNDVAGYCANTVVVMNNAGIRLVDAWIEHPNVTAVLNAGALGQESGSAIMDVIFGDVNPSGRLVYTVAKKVEDYNGEICPCCECDYTEGLYTDYRHFDQAGIEPRFEFGYGLSYTNFSYGTLEITKQPSESLSAYTAGEPADGGPADLFDKLVTLTATITNSGTVAGAEVSQLYLSFPESAKSPVRQLRGFRKASLDPAEAQTVTFDLQRRDVSIWDTVAQKWKIEAGTYTAQLGRSSRDIASEVEFQLKHPTRHFRVPLRQEFLPPLLSLLHPVTPVRILQRLCVALHPAFDLPTNRFVPVAVAKVFKVLQDMLAEAVVHPPYASLYHCLLRGQQVALFGSRDQPVQVRLAGLVLYLVVRAQALPAVVPTLILDPDVVRYLVVDHQFVVIPGPGCGLPLVGCVVGLDDGVAQVH